LTGIKSSCKNVKYKCRADFVTLNYMSWLVGTFPTPSSLCNIPHIIRATTILNVSHDCHSLSHVYCYEYTYHELATCVSGSASYVSCRLPLKMRATRSAETSANENYALRCYCDHRSYMIATNQNSAFLRYFAAADWIHVRKWGWSACKCIPNYLPVPPRINIFLIWSVAFDYFWSTSFTKRNIKWGRDNCVYAVSSFWAAANYGRR